MSMKTAEIFVPVGALGSGEDRLFRKSSMIGHLLSNGMSGYPSSTDLRYWALLEERTMIARRALALIGLLIAIVGLIWIGQGTGVFPYPASSFMINQTPWIWRGAIVLVIGLIIAWASRRFLR
ncbi:hypothetical protein [Oryzifoliimicrobium ureilyticus]|uniref:hypothetical protein n=1 Tax=Oryzifoliimicrobium ureilyticus TaxID=3113724 RepID=UPI003F665658